MVLYPFNALAVRVQLFFAKVLRSANEDEVRVLFCKFGKVLDVNLFRAFQGAPTTKVRTTRLSYHPVACLGQPALRCLCDHAPGELGQHEDGSMS